MVPVACICGASISRGQLAEHTATACPDASVTCPFAKFGCDVKDLKRRDCDKHQAEAAQKHSELVASKLSLVEARSAKQDKRIKSIGRRLADVERYATCDVKLCVDNISEKKKSGKSFFSKPFNVTLESGSISFKVKLKFGGGKMGFYIYVSKDQQGPAKLPIRIGGSSLTLMHPSRLLPNKGQHFEELAAIEELGGSLGWSNFYPNDWEAYVVNNKLEVQASVRVRRSRSYRLPNI
jgi:hypothetical protein